MKNLGHILVFFQFAGALLSVGIWLHHPSLDIPAALLMLAGGGLGIVTLMYNRIGNFNIAPQLRKQAILITNGPYRFVRHPMYLSVALALAGVSLAAINAIAWLGWTVATLAMIGKTYIEEPLLIDRFPEYKAYRNRTKRFVPFLI